MVKRWKLGRRSISCRDEDRKPLRENINNDIQDAQNTFNAGEERCLQSVGEITLQELAEFLGVTTDSISVKSNTSEDGSCCALPNSGEENQQNVVQLIQKSVHFPEPPAELDKNLGQHLLKVQTDMHTKLVKLTPLFESNGLMGCLLDCYHRQTFDHLHVLLQNISTSQNSFVLMNQDLLFTGSPQEEDRIKNVDLMLFTEWIAKAKQTLLENVQKEVRESLDKILQIERRQKGGDSEEAFIQLNVDTIQYIDGMTSRAQQICKTLSDHVQEVCFQELLVFLNRYTTEQAEILRKQTEKAEPEIKLFLKTLKTCESLKHYIQAKGKDIKPSILMDTVETLEKMEDLTMKLLLEIVADFTKNHLKKYFKTKNKQFCVLTEEFKTHYSKLSCCQDVQERVMDEVYKLITHLYVKHLVQSSQSRLRRCWSFDVGQKVTQDAELLHYDISDMAPGVQQWNLMLLKITELLECKDTDALKIVVASMQQKCITKSCREDLELLLRWKGLSKQEVREVLEALPEDQPRSVSWYSCLTCW
ncbi:hypothetical protein PAMA_004247 [Pampus argenteus]